MSRPFKSFVLIAAAVIVVFIVAGISSPERDEKRRHAKGGIMKLLAALREYHLEYGAAPVGDTAEVMAALRGQNLHEIVFLEETTASHVHIEFLDPWAMPYRIDVSKPDAVRVWSCGPNRRDDNGAAGSDDIVIVSRR